MAQVPRAGWSIFKCQLTQVSSRMREKVTEREMPGVDVLSRLGGHGEAGSWPLARVNAYQQVQGDVRESAREPHASSLQPESTSIRKTKLGTQKTQFYHTTVACKHAGN